MLWRLFCKQKNIPATAHSFLACDAHEGSVTVLGTNSLEQTDKEQNREPKFHTGSKPFVAAFKHHLHFRNHDILQLEALLNTKSSSITVKSSLSST